MDYNILDTINERGLDLIPFNQTTKIKGIYKMNITFSIISKILTPLVSLLTPQIKSLFSDFIKSNYQKALETPSPWDNFLFELLAEIFGIDLKN